MVEIQRKLCSALTTDSLRNISLLNESLECIFYIVNKVANLMLPSSSDLATNWKFTLEPCLIDRELSTLASLLLLLLIKFHFLIKR